MGEQFTSEDLEAQIGSLEPALEIPGPEGFDRVVHFDERSARIALAAWRLVLDLQENTPQNLEEMQAALVEFGFAADAG